MTINIHTTTERLSDGSEVSDVYVYDGDSRGGITFYACSAADALAFQGELLRLIAKHLVNEAREF